MSIHRIVALGTSFLLAGTGLASAQSCLGFPSRDGDLVVAGSYATMDGASEVGGDFHADVSGPTGFGFAYRTGLDDGAPSTYEARISYDLYLLEPSVCVVAGVKYMDAEGTTAERLGIPVGIGIGKTLDTGRLATTVYAIPQVMWTRAERADALGGDAVDTSTEFVGEAGLTIGLLPVFVNGAITLNTLDDEPSFRIRLGLLF